MSRDSEVVLADRSFARSDRPNSTHERSTQRLGLCRNCVEARLGVPELCRE